MYLLVAWLIILLVALVLYYRQLYSRFRGTGINHLTPLPLFGNAAGITLRTEHLSAYLKKLYDAFPEDRFVGNFEFTNPYIVVRDIELAKKVTIKDFEHFIDHRTFVDDSIDPFWGRNLFSLKGEEWKHMRSTLSPAFTSSKIRLMIPFMVEVADQTIKSLEKQIKESGNNYVDLEVKDLISRYANDVIASCAFGMKVDSQTELDNQFYVMGKEASTFKFKQFFIFFAYSCFPRLVTALKWSVFSERTQKFFKSLMSETMRDREAQNIVRPDMIHLLLEAKKGQLSHEEKVKNTDAGFATVEESAIGKQKNKIEWSENDLIAQALIFLLGGLETVSSAMAMALAELAINPDVQQRLVEEIREYDVANGGKFDYTQLQKMEYMDMVVSEVLRMWTPGFLVDRICHKDYNLGRPNKHATQDYIIRKGEGLVLPVWAFHRSPEFFPDPDKFDPERFSAENKHKINSFTYMPFGVGPRNCIGSRFALCEIKAMLYQILLRFEVSPCERSTVPLQLCNSTVNIRIKGGHWFRFRPRS
uniref:unspecific monooxygenase n=1 Tax=Cnaphalocrocis medinalis TaxID=437488 RepID=A0A0C5C1J2_CNAME|nr:cytochrome P450 monooxygenase CYP9A79 [Cnaphalocrocis medinalis]